MDKIDPVRLLPRRELRSRTAMPGELRNGFIGKSPVAIANLSLHGCRIAFHDQSLGPNTRVFVRLDNVGALAATIRWTRDQDAGIEFDLPLYLPVAEHLVSRWARSAPAGARITTSACHAPGQAVREAAACLTRTDGHRHACDGPAELVNRPGVGFRLIYR